MNVLFQLDRYIPDLFTDIHMHKDPVFHRSPSNGKQKIFTRPTCWFIRAFQMLLIVGN